MDAGRQPGLGQGASPRLGEIASPQLAAFRSDEHERVRADAGEGFQMRDQLGHDQVRQRDFRTLASDFGFPLTRRSSS